MIPLEHNEKLVEAMFANDCNVPTIWRSSYMVFGNRLGHQRNSDRFDTVWKPQNAKRWPGRPCKTKSLMYEWFIGLLTFRNDLRQERLWSKDGDSLMLWSIARTIIDFLSTLLWKQCHDSDSMSNIPFSASDVSWASSRAHARECDK